MMTFKNLRYGLSSSVVLAASLFSVLSYAATDSIGLTVITTVEMGTCTATLVNDSDQDISVVDFGDVYISEINAGNDSNLLIVFYVQIMPDDFVMQLHRF
ncbi:putative fimbrial-like adhesin protein [Escherichia coli]|nr:putative fimbrial-like adhesin protein [Escherichia coli]SRA29574.1 putative fimbrial-like adhesin protein [Escherichia coli]SRA33148.1 putative fimbrial-like adhesin protein [Escherichia coli]SRA43436.1 putative fimbrial-like adhesin protein [Escherichia coli]SRA46319.1 putative fimbrial-like adhesin protein [Escherichia coli]